MICLQHLATSCKSPRRTGTAVDTRVQLKNPLVALERSSVTGSMILYDPYWTGSSVTKCHPKFPVPTCMVGSAYVGRPPSASKVARFSRAGPTSVVLLHEVGFPAGSVVIIDLTRSGFFANIDVENKNIFLVSVGDHDLQMVDGFQVGMLWKVWCYPLVI